MKLSSRPVHYAAYQRAVRAGWATRFFAYFIDLIFLRLFDFTVIFLVHPDFHGNTRLSYQAAVRGIDPVSLAVFLASFLIYALLVIRSGKHNGQTLGKQIMGIRTMRDDGKPMNLGTFILRDIIGKFISAVVFLIGYLWPLWDKSNRAWHDIIGGTHVLVVDREGLPKVDRLNNSLTSAHEVQAQAPMQRTLGVLQDGESAYLQADILNVDNARGCWLNPNAMVGNHADHWYCLSATKTGDGFTLYITQDLVEKMAVSETSPAQFHSGGWLPVTAFKVVEVLPSFSVQAYTQTQSAINTSAAPTPPGFSEVTHKRNNVAGWAFVGLLAAFCALLFMAMPSFIGQAKRAKATPQDMQIIYKAAKAASVDEDNPGGNYLRGQELVDVIIASEPQLAGKVIAAKHPSEPGQYAVGATKARTLVVEAISGNGPLFLVANDEEGVHFENETGQHVVVPGVTYQPPS